MIRVELVFDFEKTAHDFMKGWIFQRLISPIINLSQLLWFEVYDYKGE